MTEQVSRNYKYLPHSSLLKADYNRPIDRGQVVRIKKNFNPAEVRPVIVSHRDGKYYIIDGQHTAQALFELNNNNPSTPIYCDVRTGLSYEQESDLYVRLNKNSKPICFLDEMKGLIESRNPDAIEFERAVEACGYTLFNSNKVSALRQAWIIFNQKDGKNRLCRSLALINDTWQSRRNATHALVIKGVVMFLDVHADEYNRNVFVKKLSEKDPYEMVHSAISLSRTMRSISQQKAFYLDILETYNNRLRTNTLENKYDKVGR